MSTTTLSKSVIDVNPILTVPWEGWLHPELVKIHTSLASLSGYMQGTRWAIPKCSDLSMEQYTALKWLERLPRYADGTAFSAPLLHPDVCDLLIQEIRHPDLSWDVNDEEGEAYQIPEVVLREKLPELHQSLERFARMAMYPLMQLTWGRAPDAFESIQLAKYTPEGTRMTGWHHDQDSNMTGVVNLAPELYEGGGTDVRTGVMTFEHIPPVPKGHVLIFNGHQTLHRGAPVESGERNILVFWTTTGR